MTDTPPEDGAAPQAPPPRKARRTAIEVLNDPRLVDGLKRATSKFMTPERLLSVSLNAVRKTPQLKGTNFDSFLGALMTCSAFGLEPNTPAGHCYLIPYRRRFMAAGKWATAYDCNFQMGYRGFIELAYRSPRLAVMQFGAIHENDIFEHAIGSEFETTVFFKYEKNMTPDRGELTGAFCFFRLVNENGHIGDIIRPLSLEEIHEARSCSETFNKLTKDVAAAKNATEKKKAEAKLAATPWVKWEDDMAIKTAIKKACKGFPLTVEMTAAAEIDSLGDIGVLDLTAALDKKDGKEQPGERAKAVATGAIEPVAELEGEGDTPDQARLEGPAEEEPPATSPPKKRGGRKKAAPKEPEPEQSTDPQPESPPPEAEVEADVAAGEPVHDAAAEDAVDKEIGDIFGGPE